MYQSEFRVWWNHKCASVPLSRDGSDLSELLSIYGVYSESFWELRWTRRLLQMSEVGQAIDVAIEHWEKPGWLGVALSNPLLQVGIIAQNGNTVAAENYYQPPARLRFINCKHRLSTLKPLEKLSAEDISTKIGIWMSVDQQMDDFARALNVGYGLLDNWHVRIKSNKAPVIAEINSFRTILEHAKEKLDSLRVAYLNCPDVTEALNTNTLDRLFYSIDGF